MKINQLSFQIILVTGLVIAIGIALWRAVISGEESFDYAVDIEPVLIERCYDCHGDGMDKGDVILDEHVDPLEVVKNRKLWERVYDNLEKHLMPPPDKSQPEDEGTCFNWTQRTLIPAR